MTRITDAMLAELTDDERRSLMLRLEGSARPEGPMRIDLPQSRPVLVSRRWFLRILAGCCVLLVPWIAVLAVMLPREYVAGHWRLTWIGFDLALLAALCWAAWTLWRRRPIAIAATIAAATLLLTDAWFDVTTSAGGRDLVTSALTAVLIEIPLAAALLLVSRRVRRAVTRIYS